MAIKPEGASRPRSAVPLLLIAALTAAYVLDGLHFTRALPRYPLDGLSEYFKQARDFSDAFAEFPFRKDPSACLRQLLAINARIGRYGPVYLLADAFLSMLLKRNWPLMNLIHNGFYFFILLSFIYRLTKKIAGETAGAIAVLCISSYPCVFGFYRTFSMEFALMAVAVLSIDCLIESDFFNDRKWSVLLACGCSWGLLIKYPFALDLLGPVLIGLGKALADWRRGDPRRVRRNRA